MTISRKGFPVISFPDKAPKEPSVGDTYFNDLHGRVFCFDGEVWFVHEDGDIDEAIKKRKTKEILNGLGTDEK